MADEEALRIVTLIPMSSFSSLPLVLYSFQVLAIPLNTWASTCALFPSPEMFLVLREISSFVVLIPLQFNCLHLVPLLVAEFPEISIQCKSFFSS